MRFDRIYCVAGPEPRPELPGDTRTYRVFLDPNQYQQDMTSTVSGAEVNFFSMRQSHELYLLCPFFILGKI